MSSSSVPVKQLVKHGAREMKGRQVDKAGVQDPVSRTLVKCPRAHFRELQESQVTIQAGFSSDHSKSLDFS